MSISKLEPSEWHSYFDRISKAIDGKQAEIEVDSLSIGAQLENKWLPLQGIVYDPKDNIVEILLEGLDHLVHKPREIYVDQEALVLKSIEVIDQDDVRQIVKLRDPLMLASP
jgi:hypothetical protein